MAPIPKVDFLFDFGSPNAYLSDLLIPGIEKRTGVKFDYIPVLLGGIFKATNNKSPFESFRNIPSKMAHQKVEMQRFLRKHAITSFKMNPFFPVNTLMLMRGAVAAQVAGVFEPYVKAGFRHMWEDPKKMDDVETFKAAFKTDGIDVEKLIALAQQDDVKKMLVDNTAAAVARGAFGSPTFFVGNEMFFGKDQLRDVEDEIVTQSGKASV